MKGELVVVDNSHKAIQLTEEVIADIERENRQFSVLEDEAVGLRRERDSERSRRQQLEKETRELQASNESGQLVLDELSGLKAILEGQVAGLISQIESTQESEGQDETVRQVLESNDDLKRKLDETEMSLQRCLQSLAVADRLTEMLEFVDGLDLNSLKFQEEAIKLAKLSSGNDSSFSDMIMGRNFFELPFVIHQQMISKLKTLLKKNELEMNDFERLSANQVVYQVFNNPQVNKRDFPPETTRHLVHVIHVIRNQLAHPEKDDILETKQIDVFLMLFAASLLWTDLPEDEPPVLRMAA